MAAQEKRPQHPCYPPFSPSLGTLHGRMWVHQLTCTNSVHAACPQLSLGPISDLRCTRWGVFLCWESRPREEVYTGPGGRVMVTEQGIQGFQGSSACLASAECRLHVGRFLWPHGLPIPLEVGEGRVWPRRSRVRPRAKGPSCSCLRMELDPDAPVHEWEDRGQSHMALSGCTGMSWFPALFVRLSLGVWVVLYMYLYKLIPGITSQFFSAKN